MAITRANMRKQMEGKMKTCASCKTPMACKKAGKCLAKKPMKMAKGGSFPDLTGDGKVTQADVLKGRGVTKKRGGKIRGCGMAKKGTRKAKMY